MTSPAPAPRTESTNSEKVRTSGPSGGAERTGLDKRGQTIQDMFAGVAPRYDLLNRLLSARRDVAWRKQAAAALALPEGSRVLDLCCGTGDQALAVENEGNRVIAADFCVPMLALARRKYAKRPADQSRPAGLAGDTLTLPFPNETFDGATVSFGLRNVADLPAALAEIARVLKPLGRLVVLEAAVPDTFIRGPYLWYFTSVLPAVGRLLSPRGSAYSYLPDSVLDFPQRDDFVDLMAGVGLSPGRWRNYSAGAVCLYTAGKQKESIRDEDPQR